MRGPVFLGNVLDYFPHDDRLALLSGVGWSQEAHEVAYIDHSAMIERWSKSRGARS